MKPVLVGLCGAVILGIGSVVLVSVPVTEEVNVAAAAKVSTVQVSAKKSPAQVRYTSAMSIAKKLSVKGRAPKTGYERSNFGSGWATVRGCDMRNRILARDLTKLKFKDSRKCVVISGVLNDQYTGKRINFVRGNRTSYKVQIDHVVARSDSWQKGAQKWPKVTRRAFANDPLNLLAADGPANASKGDGATATWLPPTKKFRCPYVARQVEVKTKYKVWVTQAEQSAMVRVLKPCAG